LKGESAESLQPTPQIFPFSGDLRRRPGSISTARRSFQSNSPSSPPWSQEIGNSSHAPRRRVIAAAIAAAVEEQGAATQEIARNVQQAALGSTQVAASIADVHRGAGDTGSASSQVLSSAQLLSNENKRLKAEVVKFLATVRGA
jgi:hypothetical protein